jgi:hypothetical protein
VYLASQLGKWLIFLDAPFDESQTVIHHGA